MSSGEIKTPYKFFYTKIQPPYQFYYTTTQPNTKIVFETTIMWLWDNCCHFTQTFFNGYQRHHEDNYETFSWAKGLKPIVLHDVMWCEKKVKYAIPVFEVRRTGSLCPSFSGNRLYVVVCHCFPHRFTSLSLNRLSYSFVTCWVGMGARLHWKISDRREDRTWCVVFIVRRTTDWAIEPPNQRRNVDLIHNYL